MFQSDQTVLGDDQLSTLRRAAAMAHTTGAVGLRLHAGDVAIVDVIPHDADGVDHRAAEPAPRLRVGPCEFRLAVAHLIHDELLDATVVHIELDPADAPAAPPRVLDEVLRRMVATVGAAEVVEVLTGQL